MSELPTYGTLAEHTVQSGESLGQIALKYYGSAAKASWSIIYKANREVIGPNASLIVPGQVLKIPRLEPEARPEDFMAQYTVRPGDTLSHIALWHYGTAAQSAWVQIYEANRATIGDNPSYLQVGQVLNIPNMDYGNWRTVSRYPMELSFVNQGALPVHVYWVNFDDEEDLKAQLNPGERWTGPTFETHQWIVRDLSSGRQIASVVALRSEPTFTIRTDNLRSPWEAGQPWTAVVSSYGSLELDLYEVEPDGSETLKAQLEPNDSQASIPTTVGAVFRVRERDSQSEVSMFVVTNDPHADIVVDGYFFEGHPATTLPIYNDTNLSIAVYHKALKGENYIRTIEPFQYFNQATFVTHQWVFRDAYSGHVLGGATASDDAAQQARIRLTDLRSIGGTQPPASLTLDLKMDQYVDVLRMARDGSAEVLARASSNTTLSFPEDSTPLLSGDVIALADSNTGHILRCLSLKEGPNELALDLDAYPSARPAGTIEFVNQTASTVTLDYVDTHQQRADRSLRLLPGQSLIVPTDAGTVWKPSIAAGLSLGVRFGLDTDQVCRLSTAAIRSLPETVGESITFTFSNDTLFQVSYYAIDDQGEATLLGDLGPDDTLDIVCNQYAIHQLVDTETQRILYLNTAQAIQAEPSMSQSIVWDLDRENDLLYPGEVALYSETDYQGAVRIIRSDIADLQGIGFDDVVKSVKVGPGTGVILFEDPEFGGESQTVFTDLPIVEKLLFTSARLWTYDTSGSSGISDASDIWLRPAYGDQPEAQYYRSLVSFAFAETEWVDISRCRSRDHRDEQSAFRY